MAQTTRHSKNPFKRDGTAVNILLLAVLCLIASLEALIVVAWALSFFPPSAGNLSHDLLLLNLRDLKPERETFLFQFFAALAIAIFGAVFYYYRGRIKGEDLSGRLSPWIIFGGIVLAVQVYLIFMMWVYKVDWARHGVWIMMGIAALIMVLGSGFHALARGIGRQRGVIPAGIVILLAVLIIPDVNKALTNAFLQDRFYHFDSFFMSPGWAALTGSGLNVDTISIYSMVIPKVVAQLALWMGGFTYPKVMAILIAFAFIYFALVYGFLRVWLASRGLALFGLLLALNLQMFHQGTEPIIWRFPSMTVIRYFWDIIFFFLLLRHARLGKPWCLWAMAAVCGVSLAHMPDTGLYLTASYYLYLFFDWQESEAGIKRWRATAALAILPWLTGMGILWLVADKVIWGGEFWANTGTFASYFVHGFGSLPIYEYLKDKETWTLLRGVLMPVVYLLTIMVVGGLYFARKIGKENILVIILSFYGLGLYHYFVNRSAITNYDAVCIPYVLVLCFWVSKILQGLNAGARTMAMAVLGMSAALLLAGNDRFVRYPNVLNLARVDWSADEARFAQESNLDQDVALICRYSRADQKVALFSSYATKILMEAKRKPFSFYFPLIMSRPMEALEFAGGTYICTKSALARLLDEFEKRKPPVVFVEQKLFLGQIPELYYQSFEILGVMIAYFRQNYELVDRGRYLVVLKRK